MPPLPASLKPVTVQAWRVVVTPVGSGEPIHDVSVEGDNWMAALRRCRELIGESGGMPPGASCVFGASGDVTIVDPISRHTFVVRSNSPDVRASATPPPASMQVRTPSLSAASPTTTPSQRPDQRASFVPPAPVTRPPASKKSSPPGPLTPPRASVAPLSVVATSTSATAAASEATPTAPADDVKVEAAGEPKASDQSPMLPEAKTHRVGTADAAVPNTGAKAELDVAIQSSPAQLPTSVDVALPVSDAQTVGDDKTQPDLVPTNLRVPEREAFIRRDEPATTSRPIRYIERAYQLSSASTTEADRVLREQLDELLPELEVAPSGIFVRLAAFDHAFSRQPARPPVALLEWRDWHRDPHVTFPASAGRTSLAPRPSRAAQDERLALVFEQCLEMQQLTNASDLLTLALKILESTVPSQSSLGALYDINADALRVLAVSGAFADARRGKELPSNSGLLGAASNLHGKPLYVDNVATDDRFDSKADGELVERGQYAMLLHSVQKSGRLLAVLQLVNRVDGPIFNRADGHVVSYVAEQLGIALSSLSRQTQAPPPPANGKPSASIHPSRRPRS